MKKNIFKKFFSMFIPIKKKRISIIDESRFSGSNSYALYEFLMKKDYKDKLEIKLFYNEEVGIKQKIKNILYKISSEAIITTHSVERYKKKQILIQMWHGIPLKSMGLLDKTYSEKWVKKDKIIFDETNYYISTSEFYTTLLNSTIGQQQNKYRILGYPRNDYLIHTDLNLDFEKIFERFNVNNKIIFYIPTFKNGYANRKEGNSKEENFFGIKNFDMKKFSDFLVSNNLNFIVKLHPFEEKYYKTQISKLNLNNIYFLDSEILQNNKDDLYKWLGKSDMLITDYSSVYFDYLLTKKPILFINDDEEEYRKTRGFLLEPYNFWTPGPKIKAQYNLEKEILKLLNDPQYYNAERIQMLNIFHKHQDGNYTKRVCEFIESIMLNSD